MKKQIFILSVLSLSIAFPAQAESIAIKGSQKDFFQKLEELKKEEAAKKEELSEKLVETRKEAEQLRAEIEKTKDAYLSNDAHARTHAQAAQALAANIDASRVQEKKGKDIEVKSKNSKVSIKNNNVAKDSKITVIQNGTEYEVKEDKITITRPRTAEEERQIQKAQKRADTHREIASNAHAKLVQLQQALKESEEEISRLEKTLEIKNPEKKQEERKPATPEDSKPKGEKNGENQENNAQVDPENSPTGNPEASPSDSDSKDGVKKADTTRSALEELLGKDSKLFEKIAEWLEFLREQKDHVTITRILVLQQDLQRCMNCQSGIQTEVLNSTLESLKELVPTLNKKSLAEAKEDYKFDQLDEIEKQAKKIKTLSSLNDVLKKLKDWSQRFETNIDPEDSEIIGIVGIAFKSYLDAVKLGRGTKKSRRHKDEEDDFDPETQLLAVEEALEILDEWLYEHPEHQNRLVGLYHVAAKKAVDGLQNYVVAKEYLSRAMDLEDISDDQYDRLEGYQRELSINRVAQMPLNHPMYSWHYQSLLQELQGSVMQSCYGSNAGWGWGYGYTNYGAYSEFDASACTAAYGVYRQAQQLPYMAQQRQMEQWKLRQQIFTPQTNNQFPGSQSQLQPGQLTPNPNPVFNGPRTFNTEGFPGGGNPTFPMMQPGFSMSSTW